MGGSGFMKKNGSECVGVHGSWWEHKMVMAANQPFCFDSVIMVCVNCNMEKKIRIFFYIESFTAYKIFKYYVTQNILSKYSRTKNDRGVQSKIICLLSPTFEAVGCVIFI